MGFGNPVRSDDGIGCKVIEWLKGDFEDYDNVSIFDMGTSAFEVLFSLKGHDEIIIVDGVINSNEPDGTVFKLPASEIQSSIIDDPMVFLHSLKWDQALSYAKKIMGDDFPKNNITVYLISITDLRLEINLSEAVVKGGEKVYAHIKEQIQSFKEQIQSLV
jgi:hydrogenase maturation protease